MIVLAFAKNAVCSSAVMAIWSRRFIGTASSAPRGLLFFGAEVVALVHRPVAPFERVTTELLDVFAVVRPEVNGQCAESHAPQKLSHGARVSERTGALKLI